MVHMMYPNVLMTVVIVVAAMVLCGWTTHCKSRSQLRDDGGLSRGEV